MIRIAGRARAFLPLLFWAAAGGPCAAADAATTQGELKALRGRIQSLERDLSRSEQSRARTLDRLRETEAAVTAANRRLAALAGERAAVEAEMRAADEQASRLAARIAGQEARLERLLRRQFMGGETEALRLLFAGRDPNQAARDGYFLRQLSRARAELIAGLRAARAEQADLAERARSRREALAGIADRQEAARAELLDSQRQRQAVLAEISGRIRDQRKQIETLRQDEQRLGALIRRLSAVAKAAKAARPAPSRPPAASRGAAPEPPPAVGGAGLAAFKGRLRPPLRGELGGRFGAPRPEGGTAWKGVFVRAPEGAEVRAVAAGRVVFADWMRGFGNLLVVDHDEGLLSVYGNNRELLRKAGETVRAGDALAAVGSSGGNLETGLYFELRYQGQPIDPSRWVGFR